MDIMLDDIAQMALELWLAKRDAQRLADANADLQRRLDEAMKPAGTRAEG